MDVYGKAPIGEEGDYFRASVWGWRPLAEYVLQVHPDIAAGCTYWHSNDGDGLDAQDAAALGEALRADIDSGRAQTYVLQRKARLEALPRLTCRICEGRGRRTREDDRRLVPSIVAEGRWITPAEGMVCNGCNGEGTVADPETMYGLAVEDLEEFAAFCAASGGFEIN